MSDIHTVRSSNSWSSRVNAVKKSVPCNWPEFDLDDATWTIPASRSKNGKAHIVHLSDAALRVLERARNQDHWCFLSTATSRFRASARRKRALTRCRACHWRLHDLRRTVVSGMARMGIAPHIADKVLNHQTGTMSSTAAVYQRHQFLNERKDALDRWAAHVSDCAAGRQVQQPTVWSPTSRDREHSA